VFHGFRLDLSPHDSIPTSHRAVALALGRSRRTLRAAIVSLDGFGDSRENGYLEGRGSIIISAARLHSMSDAAPPASSSQPLAPSAGEQLKPFRIQLAERI